MTLAEPGGGADTLERPGHRDSVISAPVCVRCGIHYESATKEQLAAITAACEELLQSVKEKL